MPGWTEKDLYAKESLYKTLFDHIRSGVAVYDAIDNGHNFVIADINQAGLEISQVTWADIIGKKVTEIFPGVHAIGLLDVFIQVWQTGQAQRHPMSLYQDERISQWVENYVYKLPSGKLVVVYDDVTDRKAAEDEVNRLNKELEQRVGERTEEIRQVNQELAIRSLKLLELNEELETFAYSVSHDLRAPLRAINGFADILQRHYDDVLDEQGCHFLDNIIQASLQMEQLIEDLLKYARLGRKSISPQPVPVQTVLAEVTDSLHPLIASNQATLHLPPADDDQQIWGNHTILYQALSNLLENAIVYHPPHKTPEIFVYWQPEGNDLLIQIKDNGIGIPEEQQQKIFQVFQRLHGQDEYRGTGIGLAIARKSVNLMGGKIGVESQEGQGATFWLRLPRGETTEAEAS